MSVPASRTILIVADDAGVGRLLEAMLRVVFATSKPTIRLELRPSQAEDALARHPTDLLILDLYTRPQRDHLLTLAHGDGEKAAVPVILIANRTEEPLADDAVVLVKPITFARLRAALRSALPATLD